MPTEEWKPREFTLRAAWGTEGESCFEGYKRQVYAKDDMHVPVIRIAAAESKIFPVFRDLCEIFRTNVSVVLERSLQDGTTQGYLRDDIDVSKALQHLNDFEDLVLHDGFTTVGIYQEDDMMEVMLDDHKLVALYDEEGQVLHRARTVAHRHDIHHNADLKFVCDSPHVHHTTREYDEQFEELVWRMMATSSQ